MGAKKLTLFMAVGIAFTIVLIYALKLKSESTSNNRLAADFTLQDVMGKSHALSEFRGQRVLLHFWASWCAPCLDEFPVLLKRINASNRPDLRLITVSWDQSWADARAVTDRAASAGVAHWISLIDPDRKLGPLYGTYQLPETYLLNGQQEIEMKWVGSQPWDQTQFDSVFNSQ